MLPWNGGLFQTLGLYLRSGHSHSESLVSYCDFKNERGVFAKFHFLVLATKKCES